MGTVTDRRIVVRLTDGNEVRRPDTLVAEEPLEIRVSGRPLAVTMRTPGDDVDLALGFLLTEGLITGASDVGTAKHCSDTDFRASARSELASPAVASSAGRASARSELASPAVASSAGNVLDVTLAPGVPAPAVDPTRNFYTTSSCGVCGKASIDAVRTLSRHPVADDPVRVDAEVLVKLPDRLRTDQRVFDRTGGLHAAGLFTPDGDLVCVREDVGRHNAVDKVVGWAVREHRLPLAGHVLLVSGRASFELAQKASMAGIPMLAAVSAPSTLAVDLATEVGMTLVGFLRPGRMNIYTGGDRVLR